MQQLCSYISVTPAGPNPRAPYTPARQRFRNSFMTPYTVSTRLTHTPLCLLPPRAPPPNRYRAWPAPSQADHMEVGRSASADTSPYHRCVVGRMLACVHRDTYVPYLRLWLGDSTPGPKD